MKSNHDGFTVLEIVVVLVLLSIIAATVFGRSITSDQINFVGQTGKIRNHIRYAQSLAMKRSEVWGIANLGTSYWLFTWTESAGGEGTPLPMPGEENNVIDLPEGISMTPFLLYFDGPRGGRPSEGSFDNPLTADLHIKVENLDRTQSKDFYITPETGFIREK